jgi:hypothetical protein
MPRRLFNLLAALSLLAGIGVAGVWVTVALVGAIL